MLLVLINIILVLFFALLNAFFVAAEFAMVKVRKSRIETLVSGGDITAKYTHKVVNDLNAYLSACQLGITLASLALGWIGEPAVSEMLEPLLHKFHLSPSMTHSISFFVGFAIITGLHIVLGELVPKSLAIINSEKFAKATSLPLVFFYKVTYPIIWLFNTITNTILKAMGYSLTEEHELAHTDEEIKILVEESYKHGLIDKTEYTFVDNIFDFSEKTVKDIMVPRIDMVCVYKEDSFEEIHNIAVNEKYTRYPVCEESKDDIVGFIHIKDLYEHKFKGGTASLDSFIRDIIIVPETTSISIMLKTFQKEKGHIAIVVDEYGGTAGIVTVEDILEEIVGNLSDEFDEEEKEVETLDDNTYMVDGTIHLDKVKDYLGVDLPSDDYDTLSGFLMGQMGRIPEESEKPVIEYEGLVFKVEEIEDRRILKVKVCKSL